MRYASLHCMLLLASHLQAAELADPTRPNGAPAIPAPQAKHLAALRLDGIVHSASREVAIVNGQLVKAGAWIGDAHIDAITRNCVHYTRNGRSLVLTLDAPIKVKRSPAVREDKR
jgi:hypothetical protein